MDCLAQLGTQTHGRYALELMTDANDYAQHVADDDEQNTCAMPLPNITSADILLAAELRSDDSVAMTIQPLNDLMVYADELNRVPLPLIPSTCYNGIALPDKKHQLTARTFDVVSVGRLGDRMREGGRAPNLGMTTKHVKPTDNKDMASSQEICKDDLIINNVTGQAEVFAIKMKSVNSDYRERGDHSMSSTSYGANKGKTIKIKLNNFEVREPAPHGHVVATDASLIIPMTQVQNTIATNLCASTVVPVIGEASTS